MLKKIRLSLMSSEGQNNHKNRQYLAPEFKTGKYNITLV